MKALVGAFNQAKALVGAFSVIVKTGCGTDGSICGTNQQPTAAAASETYEDCNQLFLVTAPRHWVLLAARLLLGGGTQP